MWHLIEWPPGGGRWRRAFAIAEPSGQKESSGDGNLWLAWPGGSASVPLAPASDVGPSGLRAAKTAGASLASQADADGVHRAPASARVVAVLVALGDVVAKGDPLVRLEAMKMQFVVQAAQAGQIAGLHAEVGLAVASGAPLVRLHSTADAASTADDSRSSPPGQ